MKDTCSKGLTDAISIFVEHTIRKTVQELQVVDQMQCSVDGSDGTHLWNKLPDSLLLDIFSYLSDKEICLGARLVCKHWNRISRDRSLWKKVHVPESATLKQAFSLIEQVQDCVEVIHWQKSEENDSHGLSGRRYRWTTKKQRHYYIDSSDEDDEAHDSDDEEKCFLLADSYEEYDDDDDDEDDESYAAIQSNFSVHTVLQQEAKLKRSVVYRLADFYFPQLKVLHLPSKYIHECNYAECLALSKACPTLEVTNLKIPIMYQALLGSSWKALTYSSDSPLNHPSRSNLQGKILRSTRMLKLLAKSCPNVTTLRAELTGCSDLQKIVQVFPSINCIFVSNSGCCKRDNSKFTDQKFQDLLANFKGPLKKLWLNMCNDISAEGLKLVAKHSKELSLLRLDHMGKVSSGVREILKAASHLEELYIEDSHRKSMMDERCLEVLAKNCCRLKRLTLSRTGLDLKSLALDTQFRHLSYLKLVDSGVTDAFLTAIPSIRYIQLEDCYNISQNGLLQMIINCPFLVDVKVTNSRDVITKYDAAKMLAVAARAIQASKLRSLVIEAEYHDSFLEAITKLCPHLSYLTFDRVKFLPRQLVTSLLRSCRSLSNLNVPRVNEVHEEFFAVLIQNGTCLQKLDMSGITSGINTKAVCDVLTQLPKLTSLRLQSSEYLRAVVENWKIIECGYVTCKSDCDPLAEFKSPHIWHCDVDLKQITKLLQKTRRGQCSISSSIARIQGPYYKRDIEIKCLPLCYVNSVLCKNDI